jgi:hypothetical protein
LPETGASIGVIVNEPAEWERFLGLSRTELNDARYMMDCLSRRHIHTPFPPALLAPPTADDPGDVFSVQTIRANFQVIRVILEEVQFWPMVGEVDPNRPDSSSQVLPPERPPRRAIIDNPSQ